MEKSLDGKVHCWEGLTEYIPEISGIVSSIELGAEGFYEIAKKMRINTYFIPKCMDAKITNTNMFDKYIDDLKSFGLNIGKGECEYGYKMPLPEKGEHNRKLIIFKRK